jgi:flagellar biosynthesis/type III secretory pathway M-ring protein FliF/YscJ
MFLMRKRIFRFFAGIVADVRPAASTLLGIVGSFGLGVLVLGVLDVHVTHLCSPSDAAAMIAKASSITERLGMYMIYGFIVAMLIMFMLCVLFVMFLLFIFACYLRRQWELTQREDEEDKELEQDEEDPEPDQPATRYEDKDN